jgi:uncharacterized protein YecA (UPF0149 family)
MDTRELTIDRESGLPDAAREAVRWFREELKAEDIDQALEWAREQLATRDRTRPLWAGPEGVNLWRGWKQGEPALYECAFDDPIDGFVEIDSELFRVNDSYCSAPGCGCDDVEIMIERYDEAHDDAQPQILGSFYVSASAPDRIRDFASASGEEQTVRDVWAHWCKRYDIGAVLRERVARMRPVIEWLNENAEALAKPVAVRSAPKVGRNEPCPCGSGKKFKKCCGR